MKKNTSINIEDDILAFIDNYRVLNSLSSRNKAIERIILKFQELERELDDLAFYKNAFKNNYNGGVNHISTNVSSTVDNQENEVSKTPEVSSKGKKFLQSYDNMK